MDSRLADRLLAVGLAPEAFGDPADAWRRLHERFGRRVTLIDRYILEAAHRGISEEALPGELRDRLAVEVMRLQFPGIEFLPRSEPLASDAIEVIAYDSAWPRHFRAWRRRLQAELRDIAVRIEHIGSTAVPGLAAKPVIDILVSVPDVEEEVAYAAGIERTGLPLRMRHPGRRLFRPADDRPRDVHVHVCGVDSVWERDHLIFRDYLRENLAARDAYGRLKRELADRYRDDRPAYTDAKSAFILDVIDEAEVWASAIGWHLPPAGTSGR